MGILFVSHEKACGRGTRMCKDNNNGSQKRWLTAAALLFVSWSGFAGQETSWEKATKAGTQQLKQGHYSEAEKSYLEALAEAEEFGSNDARLAYSLSNLG